jgi:hypothetical protein
MHSSARQSAHRVAFLGDTLMEREKDFGYIELIMTLRFPERNVTFWKMAGAQKG